MKRRSQLELAHLLGEGFATAVFAAPIGRWHGPVPSRQGVHLVRVIERAPERLPPFDEVEKQVRADWLTQETRGLRTAALTLLPRYEIRCRPRCGRRWRRPRRWRRSWNGRDDRRRGPDRAGVAGGGVRAAGRGARARSAARAAVRDPGRPRPIRRRISRTDGSDAGGGAGANLPRRQRAGGGHDANALRRDVGRKVSRAGARGPRGPAAGRAVRGRRRQRSPRARRQQRRPRPSDGSLPARARATPTGWYRRCRPRAPWRPRTCASASSTS